MAEGKKLIKGADLRWMPSAGVVWLLAALGAIGLSLSQIGLQDIFNPNGWPQFWRFVVASFHPDLSPEMVQLTWNATLKTLAYAVCGTFLSLLLGLLGGVLCSEVWWAAVFPDRRSGRSGSFWLGARALLAIPRAIHELLWGLLFVNLWGLDPLTAVLAIALPFGAITAKVFSELLDDTPRQPLLVLLNSGVMPIAAFAYGLFPLAFLNLLSYAFYRFECSIRSAAVLGIIGAGGLGYEILLSLQSLRYEQLWTLFYALVVLNGCVDFASAWLRRQLGCATRLDLNLRSQGRGKEKAGGQGGGGAGVVLGLWVGGLTLVGVCFWVVGADFSKLGSPIVWARLGGMLRSFWPPDLRQSGELWGLAGQTVAMSVLAIALAAGGGALLSFPAAHTLFLPGGLFHPNRRDRGIWAWTVLLLVRSFLLLCRAVPAPIWALVALFLLFPGILPGAIGLGLHNLGILGRLKAEVVENLDSRPLEALKAQGAPSSLVFLYGILPLTLPRFTAYTLYRWEVCMRETVIVGLVGAGGLGYVLTEQLSSFDYRSLGVTLVVFLALTFVVDWISTLARRSLR